MASFRQVPRKPAYVSLREKTCIFTKEYCRYAEVKAPKVFNCKAPSDEAMPCRAHVRDRRY